MSYMRAQTNGTPDYRTFNGNTSANTSAQTSRLHRFDLETTPDTSADERSRSRGPQSYSNTSARQAEWDREQVQGPSRIGRQHAHRRSASRNRIQNGPGMRNGTADMQAEGILRHIEQHWSFMASDACIPIKVALQLIDSSSLGLADQSDQFQNVHQQLQNALKVVVNEHHQGFNSSIGTFHKIQAAIHTSQHRVRSLRTGLIQAKSSLSTSKPELQSFASTSHSYDQMLHIIATIEELQLVPDRFEAHVSEKRWLAAVATLQEALNLIRRPEMEDIGALSDLKVYLSNQEHSLADILIEELHNHLYLKSPYCEERWKAHINRQTLSNDAATLSGEERAMHVFLESYDGRIAMQEDPARNPEAGTFYYIQLLVESLNQMKRLDVAVDAIEQRLPVELFRVVERSHGEVEQRHPHGILRSTASQRRHDPLGVDGAGTPDGERKAMLEDLLTTLYAKFEAIAEGHRVLHDIMAAILQRDAHLSNISPEEATALNKSFREFWKLLQSEIRSLLHDHLATNEHMAGQKGRGSNDPSANIFRPQPRDKTRKLFKLADTDSKSAELVAERENLEFILKASVPGLVNTQQAQQAQSERGDNATVSLSQDRSATGHKLLVEPSVFNMSILLEPSLSFLNRLKDVVPPHYSGVGAATLTSFLDDFLINVFYPQLEETLLDLCSRAMNDIEAFQVDPLSTQKLSSRTIFKGTTRFFTLIEAFCTMLDALPHEQGFSQLVITQLRAYYDRCYQWSKNILQRAMASQPDGQGGLRMRLAADLATSGEVNDTVIGLLEDAVAAAKRTGADAGNDSNDPAPTKHSVATDSIVLAEKESALLIKLAKSRRLEEADLIHDRKALAALCTLHVSMKWLAARCSALRYISPRAVDMHNPSPQQTSGNRHSRRWTTTAHPTSAPAGAYLPLDMQTAMQFDAAIASLTELSTLILRTLHIDLRLHLLHGIYSALDTTYELAQPYNDPDPAILALASSLSSYDAQISAHLMPAQYLFLTQYLDTLANNALCALVGVIPGMDEHGVRRMELNVLVLQQAMKNLQPTTTLDRAGRFYGLAEQGPEAVAARGLAEGFDKGDLKALVRLCYDQNRDGPSGSVEEMVARLV